VPTVFFDRRTRQPPTAPDGLSGGRCAELKNGGLKDVIENKGGHRFFSNVQRERDLQIMYRLVWIGTPSDVSA
jgi:hypothetical protein